MNRVAIYFFYDEKGIVRRNTIFFIEELRKSVSSLIVVANGEIDEKGLTEIKRIADHVLIRSNEGFDVWAYRDAMEFIGFDNFFKIDELLLTNSTSFGPIYPFSEVFEAMKHKSCDFWGLSKHPEQNSFLLSNKRGYINEHIMFFFVLIRKTMLNSDAFKQYWYNIPFINSKVESVGLHEVVFTKYFTDLGYTAETYVDLSDYEGRCENSSIVLPNEQAIKSRNPLVKKRAFIFPNYDTLIDVSSTWQVVELLRFIREQTDYDEALIWEEILQRYKLSVFRRNMHLTHILHEEHYPQPFVPKLGIAIYIPCSQLTNLYLSYLRKIDTTIIKINIYYSDPNLKGCIEEFILLRPNIDIFFLDKSAEKIATAMMLECGELSRTYDFICFVCNPIRNEPKLWVSAEDFARQALNAVIDPAHYSNIFRLFQDQPFLGMINTVPSTFGSNFSASFELLQKNRFRQYQDIHEQLQLSIPFDDSETEIIPCIYWLRGDSARNIINRIKESNAEELFSSEIYAAEFFFPRLVQEFGAYPISVISSSDAAISLDTQRFDTQRIYTSLQRKIKMGGFSCINAQRRIAEITTLHQKRDELVKSPFNLREIISINGQYLKNKIKSVLRATPLASFIRKIRASTPIPEPISLKHATLANITIEDKYLLFFITSSEIDLSTTHLSLENQNFYPLQEKSDLQQSLTNYHKSLKRSADFFRIPLDLVVNTKIKLICDDNKIVQLQWIGRASFNALELRDKNIYFRIKDNIIFCETKKNIITTVLKSRQYCFRDKLLLFICWVNPFHPLTLFAENFGASDNAYQLFLYALKKKERVYYVCSSEIKNAQNDSNIKKHMLVYNSRRHVLAMLFAKRWITSFALRIECWPTTNVLKDIHYALLPAEWIFIPHGITLQDKIAYMCICYNWENPTKTFVCSPLEKKAFNEIMGFKQVECLGAPRMDKWFNQKIDSDHILLFFTWRLSLSRRTSFQKRDIKKLLSINYFKSIYDCVATIHENFPDKQIHYVFHHEIVKNKLDCAIQEMLSDIPIDFIYLNHMEGIQQFNQYFANSKYLVTDVSSVAYDFAYKEEGITIYYQPSGFVKGHYDINEEIFEQIHLGAVAHNNSELIDLLQLQEKNYEMKQRMINFYKWIDNYNSERVYRAIFRRKDHKKHTTKRKPISNFELTADVIPAKRLGIFFLYDKDGIVDSYVYKFLEGLRTVCTEICVVVNGYLAENNIEFLRQYCNRLIIRENIGFDSGAYKEALESYGFHYIREQYQELILCNFTSFGPIYPFERMMNEMSKRTCDFWGHCRHSGGSSTMGNKRVNSHLMSHFLVFKSPILESPHFEKYWATLKCARKYEEAIWYHELRCTQYFEKLGFIADAYIPFEDYAHGLNAPVYYAYTQLTKHKSPLLKRKVFFVDRGRFQFAMKEKHTPFEILRYLRTKTNYDPFFILENLERTQALQSLPLEKEIIPNNAKYSYQELLEAAGKRTKER